MAIALGGSRNGKWYNIPGPGHSSADRSLGFCFDPLQPSGIGIFSLAGDDPATCRKHVINKLTLLGSGVLPVIELKAHEASDHAATTAKALAIWHAAVAVAGSPAESYLANRGCLPASPACLNDILRFHPTCPMGATKVPAMVSIMRDASTGEPTGIHRTALADDGLAKRTMLNGMPAKMMLGPAAQAVVMLSKLAPSMGIAEGIETALSAQKIFGLPVWACGSARGIHRFPAIHGVHHLTIFADHDDPGIAAARKCGARLLKAGIKGGIKYPSTPGDDWNCYLQKGTHNV
ncbi:toprim domain-containing protein [Bradyrhizobium sp.]|uniref:DUF7146 domain-containing protein n=1 Tax=Bradyrhizobium sp. TaxID=376 RepID=UPI0025BF019C|nr:toprim domain-containing protein [Bradyrhizobium sp.]